MIGVITGQSDAGATIGVGTAVLICYNGWRVIYRDLLSGGAGVRISSQFHQIRALALVFIIYSLKGALDW